MSTKRHIDKNKNSPWVRPPKPPTVNSSGIYLKIRNLNIKIKNSVISLPAPQKMRDFMMKHKNIKLLLNNQACEQKETLRITNVSDIGAKYGR